MISNELIHINSEITVSYRHSGHGDEAIVCFHGFGEEAAVFDVVASSFPGYRFVSIDLPFHGNSRFPSTPVSKTDWKKIFHSIIEELSIEKMHLVSYSLGGRFLIRTVIDFPDQVLSCTAIASDGFHYTFWYNLAVSRFGGNRFFRHQMRNPEFFFKFCDFLDDRKLINPSMTKFARVHLNTQEQRDKVFNSWTYLKPLKTSTAEFASILKQNHLPMNIYVGNKDYIIKESFFNKILLYYPPTSKTILEARHHEMIGKWIDHFMKNEKSFRTGY